MPLFNLDTTYKNKVIKTNSQDLRFKYNTNQDYFYFDIYDVDGKVISYHNKVVTGFQFTGFIFTSTEGHSYATVDNVTTFKLVAEDG